MAMLNHYRKVMRGEKIGSFFTKAEGETIPVEVLAKNGRNQSCLYGKSTIQYSNLRFVFFVQPEVAAAASRP